MPLVPAVFHCSVVSDYPELSNQHDFHKHRAQAIASQNLLPLWDIWCETSAHRPKLSKNTINPKWRHLSKRKSGGYPALDRLRGQSGCAKGPQSHSDAISGSISGSGSGYIKERVRWAHVVSPSWNLLLFDSCNIHKVYKCRCQCLLFFIEC
ncbi:hypothetical protein HG535_0H00680 [Zygotorulaspora mrakii]|uniref:Uncharacterized protein n=1 Tax=Zygotorulaspora mrakii TaxID=42260 RepID=A0A7H9B8A7_ZYGMR|nr:uncharacterized protein HG535_0H00680 [Zygotorulaspora mrakii]QLG74743.1 hypothetical protein HG535_0H00680 [Zygotorulaspora mrakii]